MKNSMRRLDHCAPNFVNCAACYHREESRFEISFPIKIEKQSFVVRAYIILCDVLAFFFFFDLSHSGEPRGLIQDSLGRSHK
jgi:hypothetical protein